ncbi:MAG TPA: site-2 protease family protein [Candidatus Binatia bacterium]|nr:site-2 protease family protein [Candidatus Binatia bacterium]
MAPAPVSPVRDRPVFMNFNPAELALWIVPFLAAVVFHEWAHGYVANRLGDDTAKSEGRLTLNPLVHIDPLGTILLPGLLLLSGSGFLFGWAKPVPVAFHRLNNPLRDMIYVSAAGPAMNLALAFLSAGILAGIAIASPGAPAAEGQFEVARPIMLMCQMSLQLNVLLAVFNMLPIPPLDGGRVAVGLLPRQLGEPLSQIEPYGFLVILTLLLTNVLNVILRPVMGLVYGAIDAVFGIL